MRPKKVILCVFGDGVDLSVLRLMLQTHAYDVLAAATAAEAIRWFRQKDIRLVIADERLSPMTTGGEVIGELKQIWGHVPMILLGPVGDRMYRADAILNKSTIRPAEFLEQIKVMSIRKRGPRKGAGLPFSKKPIASEDAQSLIYAAAD